MESNAHFQILFRLALTLIFMELLSGAAPAKTDAEALLLFRAMIREDPTGVLEGWQRGGDSCAWNRLSCSGGGRVAGIDLSGCRLAGALDFSPLASLDMLSSLNLSFNSFTINSTSLLLLPPGLTHLELSFAGLAGPVPAGVFSRCPNLVKVDASRNNLTGFVPPNLLLNSYSLQSLDLSYNNLTGSLAGLDFGASCNSLLQLDLSGNRFTGAIPASISNCTNLKALNLSFNLLTGTIPGSVGQLTSLQLLDFSHNQLAGAIPLELKNACGSLLQLKLSHNHFSGEVPFLSSCSWLQILDLSTNNISRPFPESLLQELHSLEILLLSNNSISGSLPITVSSCRSLQVVDFSSNKLSGVIPPDICPRRRDSSLRELRAADNLIQGGIPAELSRCRSLETIDFSLNCLNGSIPPELGRLENLQKLMAWFNGLEGTIPKELGGCKNLKDLIMNNNYLTGEIPVELFSCSDLEWVSLSSNKLFGKIPREFGRLMKLSVLQLANNSFSGQIPIELENCRSLIWLDLNSNRLAGEIPRRLGRMLGEKTSGGILSGNTIVFVRNIGNSCKGAGGLLEFAGIQPERLLREPNLRTCDFTRLYSGAILSLFTQYQTLEYLDLSYNELHGKIPDEFGEMVALQVMDLAHNQLSGEIPSTLGGLKNLGVFEVSHNRLQGRIPGSFTNLSFLVQIDLSYNQLTGQIPTTGQLSTLPASQFEHNAGLCGVPLPECGSSSNQPAANSNPPANGGERGRHSRAGSWANSVILSVLVSVASVCILLAWVIAMHVRRRGVEGVKMLSSLNASHSATTWEIDREKEPLSINVATFQKQLRKLKFSQLIEATNGFSAESLIGCGGFGEVFKATLKDGSSVAIKKLIRLSCQGDREFMAEMETLGKIMHRNLVPLLGYCKVGEERLLVYEFMPFGSLEERLHGKRTAPVLTWPERKKIARGAGKGLCFLHHNCIPHIIHRDMKSSNVLLDQKLEARVSDFGMARLISALDTHLSVSTLAGTPGYVPPEYYQSFRCTAKGDVYSFGVIVLELLTGKRPTDKEDFGDTNLVGWVKMKMREGKGMEVIDPELVCEESEVEEVKEMMRYLEVTMQCVEDFPSRRPSMLQVVAALREVTPEHVDQNSSH